MKRLILTVCVSSLLAATSISLSAQIQKEQPGINNFTLFESGHSG